MPSTHPRNRVQEMFRLGLMVAASATIVGAFAPAARADNVPTGLPPSPLFGVQKFTQPMPRFDILPRLPVTALNPPPTEQSNQTQHPVDPQLGGGLGPIEGRPPGPVWAHQGFARFPPQIAIDLTMEGAKTNTVYDPGVAPQFNSGLQPGVFPFKFHPALPTQGPLAMWTYNGTLPPKLMIGRYQEPILFRLHNKLPANKDANGGFGIHSISTHEHNGHHGAENDGFTGAYFWPDDSTIITIQSCSRGSTASTPPPPIRARRPPTRTTPARRTSPATGARR